MQSSPGDDMAGGEACDSPKWGGGQHCFVHLEPFGVSTSNLVVALEHELVHFQRTVKFACAISHPRGPSIC